VSKKFTLKEKKFIEAYLQTGNATEAARKAGYAQTPGALRVTAVRLLTKANIQKHIQSRLEECEVTSNEVINTLASQMRADITELFNDFDSFDLQTIREKGLGHLIKKIKVKREIPRDEDAEPVDVIELELHSQQAAAVQLCKVLGIEQEPAKNKGELAKRMLKKLIAAGATKEQAADDLLRMAVDKSDVDAALSLIERHETKGI
jgi:phage terminase small subunit